MVRRSPSQGGEVEGPHELAQPAGREHCAAESFQGSFRTGWHTSIRFGASWRGEDVNSGATQGKTESLWGRGAGRLVFAVADVSDA